MFGAAAQSSGSVFGAPAQSSGSLFGAPAQSTASLFGAAAQSSGSVFGAPAQSSSSLFGAPAQSSASLFGAPPQSSGSLFGAPAQSTPSLFGAPTQSSASLFGAAQSSSSLFGGQPQSSGSLFGAQPAAGAGAPSLFGSAPQQQQGSVWQNGAALGGPQQNAQAPVVEITGRTRISQLPQNYQTDLFAVERHLREQRLKSSRLWSKHGGVESQIDQVQSRSSNVTRRLVKLRADIEALQANANTLKAAVRTERGSAEPVLIALDNVSKSTSTQVNVHNSFRSNLYNTVNGHEQGLMTHVPDEYFTRIMEELESRAHEYKGDIDEIAEFLRAQGVLLSSTSGSFGMSRKKERAQGSVQLSLLDNISQRHMDIGLPVSDPTAESRGKTIEDIIRRQYEYFMVVASHVAGVHENLRSVRDQYLQLLRVRDPDALNPFEQADSREKAEKERQRILAEKRASEDSMGFGGAAGQVQNGGASLGVSGFAAPASNTTQPQGLFGNASAAASQGSSAFGASTGASGFGGGSLFGDTNGTTLGAPSSRRPSGSRRKR